MQIKIIEGSTVRKGKQRVCAYCRVSTDAEEQENSLDNQIAYYKGFIQSNPDYEYAGVYSDFAISGYKEKRPGFQHLMEDARKGKMDLILTKSVSRFARNTAIVLKATRELKELNVGVFFELQNINTLSGEGELMLSIIAAFAQAESESGSMGAKMVYKRKYEAGIPVQYLERSFGYTKNEAGKFVPESTEAKWVKKIYKMAAEGYTAAAIKRILNQNGVLTVGGVKWIDSTVFRLIENEIYEGDYIMQKSYVNEERKQVKNRGEVNAWYITDDHQPIVSRELWQRAQDGLNQKREYLATGSIVEDFSEENYPYRNKIFCAECGQPLYHRIYSNGNRLCWDCSGVKRYGKKYCKGINVPDSVIREWNFDENIFIKVADRSKGVKQFSYTKESSWRRRNKQKEYITTAPPCTQDNYPYISKIHCAICGSKLTRHIQKGNKVIWICGGYKRKGKAFCEGVRVPDSVIRRFDITTDVYISERKDKHGKKHYGYSGKKPGRNTAGCQTD
ncbi:DNA invertase Pin-like site-specific DNA recombinase [Kineothrix alysoides]|uniref:DNA invertase Pin-like site-specific DNA recombinase n=1 Tax=Kineothrix alysoides TaxID=1469948 RepID=A0A4R1R4Z9_9FIRM|nr:recombinase family protein [Kineothrix alysoides]TCL60585.1 DNA invertase Pin-like site-specific DNA recombinase [Kineothrix alysoides]